MTNGIGNKARGGGVAIFVRYGINYAVKMQSNASSEVELRLSQRTKGGY